VCVPIAFSLTIGSRMVRSRMVRPRLVRSLTIHSLVLDPRAVNSGLFDPRLLDARSFDPRSFDPRLLDARSFDPLTLPPLTFDTRTVVAVALLFAPECNLPVALALVLPVVGVVHSARRRLISPDDTSIARHAGDGVGTARRPRLPSWRHAVDPDPAQPSWRALSRRDSVNSGVLRDRRNGSPQHRQQSKSSRFPHRF
jgi:hypothetical protein